MRQLQQGSEAVVAENRLLTRGFVFLCASNFFQFFALYSLFVTLPVYATNLGGGDWQAGFVTAATTIVSFLTLPHLGRYVERMGRTPLLRLGPALLLAEALVLPFVDWFPLLILIATTSGAAMACFQTGANTLVADLAPVRRRGEALGIYGTFTTTAVAISPAVSIFLMQSSGFSVLFGMTAVVAAITLALSFMIKEPRRPVASVRPGPLLNPSALLPAFCVFGMTLTYGALISFLPGQAPKIGMQNAGLFFTAYSIATLLVRALAGGVSDRLGRVPVILPALFAIGASMMIISQSNGEVMILGAAFLYGLGYGAAHPTIMALTVDRAGADNRASAVATFYAGYNLGLSVGSLAFGFLLAASSFAVMAAVAGAAPLIAMAALYFRESTAGRRSSA